MLETLRSGRLVARPAAGRVRGALGARLGRRARVAPSRAAPPASTSPSARAGVEPGDEVVTTPFSFVASANCLLYENARPVFCDIDPRTLNIDPDAAAAAVGERTTGLLPGAHLRLSGRHAGVRAAGRRARAVARRGRLRGARRASTRTGRAWARAATWPSSASTRTSRSRRGRAARWSAPTPASRSASTPSATRAARPTWAGSTTTGSASTTASTTSPARSGVAQLERLDELLAARARVAALYSEALAGRRGPRRCPARTRAATAAAGSSTSSSCRPAWTATPPSRRCASAAWTRSPTCRRST